MEAVRGQNAEILQGQDQAHQGHAQDANQKQHHPVAAGETSVEQQNQIPPE